MEFLKNIWATLVNYYNIYSDFIHSIFPSQVGDLVEYILNIVIIIAVIKLIWSSTFSNKEV